jgi:hexokinase
MADVPKDLLQEIKRLEDLFTVDTAKLKSITDHFVKELAKGEKVPNLKTSANIVQV